MVADRRVGHRAGRRPVEPAVGDAECDGHEQQRGGERPPGPRPEAAPRRHIMGRVPQRRPQRGDELGPRGEIRGRRERPAQAVADGAPTREFVAARRAPLQVPQQLVVRLREQLFGERRIGQFSDVTAFHGMLEGGSGARPTPSSSRARRAEARGRGRAGTSRCRAECTALRRFPCTSAPPLAEERHFLVDRGKARQRGEDLFVGQLLRHGRDEGDGLAKRSSGSSTSGERCRERRRLLRTCCRMVLSQARQFVPGRNR